MVIVFSQEKLFSNRKKIMEKLSLCDVMTCIKIDPTKLYALIGGFWELVYQGWVTLDLAHGGHWWWDLLKREDPLWEWLAPPNRLSGICCLLPATPWMVSPLWCPFAMCHHTLEPADYRLWGNFWKLWADIQLSSLTVCVVYFGQKQDSALWSNSLLLSVKHQVLC